MKPHLKIRCRHDHCDQMQPIPLRRARKTVEGLSRGAGFQTGGSFVPFDELIRVGQTKFRFALAGFMYDGILPCGGIVSDFGESGHQFPAHQGNIMGTGLMPIRIQTAGIFKMGILHPQFLRFLIHPFHKGFLAACHKFRHGNGCIIGRSNGDAFGHICCRLGFSRLQKDLRTTHGCRVLTDLHTVFPLELSAFLRFINQQQRHNLRYTGRRHGFMAVFFIQDRSRCRIHQKGTFACQFQRSRFFPKNRKNHPHRQEQRQKST